MPSGVKAVTRHRPKTVHFNIGDSVRVVAVSTPEYDDDGKNRIIARRALDEPVTGQVVGCTYRHEGTYRSGYYDEPARLKITGTVLLVKVATSWTSKPVEARVEDISLPDTKEVRDA